jgi:proteasome lid subunit RPN8/RPN11
VSGCVSITDRIVGLERQQHARILLPAAVAALEGLVARRSAREREIRRARMPAAPKAQPASSSADSLIDFRPYARPRHVVRFDDGKRVLDETLSTIRDYVQTAGPVGVETGGFLWGPERPSGIRTTVTRVSGPAPDSKHEEKKVVLGDPCKVDVGGALLRADLIPLGDFHSHPVAGSGLPSPDDRRAWVESLRRSRLPSYVGVIVYRSHSLGSWGSADLSAWVTYRESATGRYVVEPATITRED